jgi:hypothetical protein
MLRFSAFLAGLILLTSCEYRSNDEYFRDLEPVPPEDAQITIKDHGDMILIMQPESFNVSVYCPERLIYYYRLLVNGTEKYQKQISHNVFTFTTDNLDLSDGVYKLTVEVFISSASGGIGDKLGVEGYVLSRDYTLYVMTSFGPYYPDLVLDQSGGQMRLYVDVPVFFENMGKMAFLKTVTGTVWDTLAQVTGSGHFEVTDSTFVGEHAEYRVIAYLSVNSGESYIPAGEGMAGAYPDLPGLSVTLSPNGFPLLKWRKSSYPDNLEAYRIFGYPSYSSSYFLLGNINNADDTVFEATDAVLPSFYMLHVASIPRIPLPGFSDQVAFDFYSAKGSIMVGLPSISFQQCLTPKGHYIYVIDVDPLIREYSTSTNTVTHEFTSTMGNFSYVSVSANRKYLLASTGPGALNFLFVNLTTYEEQWIEGADVVGSGNEGGPIAVSDNGVGTICSGNRIVMHDFISGIQVNSLTFPMPVTQTEICANGRYFFVQADKLFLMENSSGTFEQKWNSSATSGEIRYFGFDPLMPDVALLLIDQSFSTRRCSNWMLLSSFSLDCDDICNIDFEYGRILCQSAQFIKTYNFNNGALLHLNPTANNYDQNDFRLMGNSIYISKGARVTIF